MPCQISTNSKRSTHLTEREVFDETKDARALKIKFGKVHSVRHRYYGGKICEISCNGDRLGKLNNVFHCAFYIQTLYKLVAEDQI